MPITLLPQNFTINAVGGVLDSRNPSGVAPNVPPSWSNIPDQTLLPGNLFTLASYASDPGGDSLTFARVGGTAPVSLTVNAQGVMTIPTDTVPGVYTMVVSVTDGRSTPVQKTFNVTVTSLNSTGNWATRIAGANVVWHHNFASEAEVNNFIRLPNDFAQSSSTAPGGFSLNRNITFGVHDPILHARRVPDPSTSSGYALEITNIGSTLAADIDAVQMYIDLVDASAFPDPANDPAKYYWLAIHADNDSDTARALWFPGLTAGSKGLKECVTVRQKSGNRLFLAARGNSYGESNAGGGIAAKPFKAGTPVGQDSDGGWNRPFAPLTGAINGRGADDPAANGTLTVRSNFTPAAQGQQYADSFYAQPFYKQFAWDDAIFDGEEFYMQWRVKFSPSRNDPLCPAGKQMWIDCYSIGSNQEWVTGGPGWRSKVEGYVIDNNVRTYTNFGTTLPGNTPYDWTLGEYQTVMVRMRPGYAKDHQVPNPGKNGDTHSSLTVDTTYFTPTNVTEGDGVRRLRFETTVPPIYPWLPNAANPGPNGETTNRHDPEYWNRGGWQATWPTTTTGTTWPTSGAQFAGGTSLVESAQVIDYGGGVTRMRWSLIKKGATAFTTGVPANGAKMLASAFDIALAYPPEYLRQEWDVWVKRPGQAPVQVYSLRDYITPMGFGISSFSTFPPGYNGLQATGYGNVWDNLAPRASTTSTRWADVIFSKSVIPWPED